MAKALSVRERRLLIEKLLLQVVAHPNSIKEIMGYAIDHLKDPQLQALSDDLESYFKKASPAPAK